VVVGGGSAFAARAAERFLSRGVDVCTALALDDLHSIAAKKNPTAIVIPVETAGESGYLTCAKLRLTRPKMRVVLVGEATPAAERLARFVGARFATEATAADVVLKLI
jgi:ActR/RegA family two-component response regulator